MLFHYTNIEGVQGILRQGQLWSTHFEYLNDRKEIFYAKEKMFSFLREDFRKLVRKEIENGFSAIPEARNIPLEEIADRELQDVVELAHKSVLRAFGGPFICSFSDVNNQHFSKPQRDGLLSMWRSYGKDGGYALIFDKKN